MLTTPYGVVGLWDSHFEWKPFLAVVALGAVGTGVAFVLAGTLFGRVGATRGAVIAYLIPVVALILGVVFRDETVELLSIAGLALVIVGAALTSTAGPVARTPRSKPRTSIWFSSAANMDFAETRARGSLPRRGATLARRTRTAVRRRLRQHRRGAVTSHASKAWQARAVRRRLGRHHLAGRVRRARRHRDRAGDLRRGAGAVRAQHRRVRRRDRDDRADAHRPRHRGPEAALPRSAAPRATRCGASCSASPTPAATSPACRRRPCATATSSSSTGRRSGRRAPSTATGASCSSAPNPDAPKHRGITSCSST